MTPRILTIPYHQLLQVDKILSKLDLPEVSSYEFTFTDGLHVNVLYVKTLSRSSFEFDIWPKVKLELVQGLKLID